MCHSFPAFFPPKAHSHQINLLKAPLLTCYSHAQEATVVSCCLHRRAQYPLPDQQSFSPHAGPGLVNVLILKAFLSNALCRRVIFLAFASSCCGHFHRSVTAYVCCPFLLSIFWKLRWFLLDFSSKPHNLAFDYVMCWCSLQFNLMFSTKLIYSYGRCGD